MLASYLAINHSIGQTEILTWMCIPNSIAVHPIIVKTFHSTPKMWTSLKVNMIDPLGPITACKEIWANLSNRCCEPSKRVFSVSGQKYGTCFSPERTVLSLAFMMTDMLKMNVHVTITVTQVWSEWHVQNHYQYHYGLVVDSTYFSPGALNILL